jgi:hypothetical protein
MTTTQIIERAEKARKTTRRKAQRLEQDGYKIEPQEAEPGVYYIRRPGEPSVLYEVDLFNETCSCPLFYHHGDCKHLIATRAAVLKALALTTPLLPLAAPLRETLQRN